MSKNRVVFVLIGLALVAATVVSLRQVVGTKAAGAQPSLQAVAGVTVLSAHADALDEQPRADRSYDRIETIRQNRNAPATALHSGKCLDDECSYQLSNGRWVR